MSAKSRFVWFDFNCRDVEGAKRFYGELFNWKFEAKEGDPYLHISAGGQMIGGMRAQGPGEKAPPHWLGYVNVDDVAATCEAMKAAGGMIHMPPTAIPTAGTFAVAMDPTGAVLAPWKSARAADDEEPKGFPAAYTFCWHELLTTDPDKAVAFYKKTFGWGSESMDMGPMGTYHLLKRTGVKDDKGQDKSAGGIMKAAPGVPTSFWLYYVAVPSVDAATEKAKKMGASVVTPPTDIPGMGRFAIWMDPQGAAIAVFTGNG